MAPGHPERSDAGGGARPKGYALRLEGVTKRYGEFTAVADLSLEIPAGTIWGILGPNGAGKTTTLRMVNDILAPDDGTIRVLGGLAPGRAAARRMGYLPEERGLYPKMRVAAALAFFAELRGLSGREARRRAAAWLERLELGRWARNKVQDLSKGMQQKLQFAVALIHEPELLVLDEPWSGLDPINADVLRTMVLEQKDAGRSVILSTHGMEQAEQICDGVTIIARGKKVLDGALDAIRREASTGRLVAIGFAGDAAVAAAGPVLADAALVHGRRERRGYLEVELAEAATADGLLAALVGARVAVRRFEVVEPTLHQIFVDRVGTENARPSTPLGTGSARGS